MNKLEVIEQRQVLNKDFKVYGDFESPLFLAKDVAEWIDYAKTGNGTFDISRMLDTVDEEEKLKRTLFVSGQNREMWFLTEDGLYEVLMQSRKPIAKVFKKEVKSILKEIRKTGRYIANQNTVSFKEQVECIAVIGDILRVNDASRLYMINELYKSYSLPTGFLPQYVSNGNRDMKSATELLKRFELGISTKSFNILLKTNGFLEERTRRSTKDETKSKKYNALTGKGLKYGENLISPHSQREVQPMYYAETFEELYKMVV